METIYYKVIDDRCNSYHKLKTRFNINKTPGLVASDAADDHYSNCGGLDYIWPITISLHETEGGQEVARMTVEMEMAPLFFANYARTSAETSNRKGLFEVLS